LTAFTNPRHVTPFIFRFTPNPKSRQTRLVWRMQPHYSPIDPPRGPFWL